VEASVGKPLAMVGLEMVVEQAGVECGEGEEGNWKSLSFSWCTDSDLEVAQPAWRWPPIVLVSDYRTMLAPEDRSRLRGRFGSAGTWERTRRPFPDCDRGGTEEQAS
jgi:hypothetical protein